MDNKKAKKILNSEQNKYYFKVSDYPQLGFDWVRFIHPCGKKGATHYTENRKLAFRWKSEKKIYYYDNFARRYLNSVSIDIEFRENFIRIDK